jgi:serine/threonine-protein kinase RsbW
MQPTPSSSQPLGETAGESAVTLSLPARHEQLPILRLLTEAVAMRNNCTLDQAADLKLAVDQIGTLLMSAAAENSALTCRYEQVDDTLQTSLSAVTVSSWEPERGSIEWRMLSALADSVSISQHPTESGRANESTVTVCTRKPA